MFISFHKRARIGAILVVFAAACSIVTGQSVEQGKKGPDEFCRNNGYYDGGRRGHSEVRQFSVPATGRLSIDAGRNGGISVKGGDVSDIQVKACVTAWGESEDAARGLASSVRIPSSGEIKAEGPGDDAKWGVSYSVIVPRRTDLELKANNGGIAISGVNGRVEFETMNGGIAIRDTAGSVRGHTTNGGINVALSGNTWAGDGLDVSTTNGGIHLSIPDGYSATLDTGTVNGSLKSDLPSVAVTTEDQRGNWDTSVRAKQVITTINGGGAPIKVRTTNGGVKISSSSPIKQ